jgi:hypothetical protein
MYSQAERQRITKHICEQLLEKRPLYRILEEDEGLCSAKAFADWQRDDPDISQSVTRAREAACERLIEETIEIADDRDEDANSRKVRIQARKDAAAMLAPRKYGQRIDVTSGGKPLEAPPPTTVVIDNRIQALLSLATHRATNGTPPLIDVTPGPSIDDVMS